MKATYKGQQVEVEKDGKDYLVKFSKTVSLVVGDIRMIKLENNEGNII